MSANYLVQALIAAQQEGRRLAAPLIGFPGLTLTGGTIKLAQQNYGEHFNVIKAVADAFQPDIIFPLMDLAVEANALGRFTVFPQTEPAAVMRSPLSMADLSRGAQINIALDTRLLGYVETVKLMRIGLPKSILKGAYVTGPYSLAAMLMGADDAALATLLDPGTLHAVCRFATEKILQYVRLLIGAGAQVITILEPSAVMLGPDPFAAFSADYVRYIVESFKYTDVATIYHTCGNAMHLTGLMAAAGVTAVSLDSREAGVHLPAVAQRLPPEVVVMGNLCPTGTLLTGRPADVEREVSDLLAQMAPYPGFVLSTGCDLPQETPIDNIQAFMRAGRRYRTGSPDAGPSRPDESRRG